METWKETRGRTETWGCLDERVLTPKALGVYENPVPLTVEAVREACAPAASVPALAALVGSALDDIAARTSRAAS